MLLLSVMIADNHRFVIRRYEVSSDKTTGEMTFAFLTDLHAKEYGKDNEKLLHAIDQCHPDAVLVGGDMIVAAHGMADEKAAEACKEEKAKEKSPAACKADTKKNRTADESAEEWMEKPLSLLGRLAEKYPVYYVNGNHELKLYWHREFCGDAYAQLMTALEEAGVTSLHNRAIPLNLPVSQISPIPQSLSQTDAFGKSSRCGIMLYGLELDYPFYKKFHRETLTVEEIERLIGKPDPSKFTILITHNPRYFETYAAWGADLVLCGHVHGGIARLPFLGGVISPYITLFPKYSGGRYVLPKKDGGESVMILSCGLGMHTLPVRFLNPAELSVITLRTNTAAR